MYAISITAWVYWRYLSSVSVTGATPWSLSWGLGVLPVLSFSTWPPSQMGYLIEEGRCFFQNHHRYPPLCRVRHCFVCRVVNHCSFIVKHSQSGLEWRLKLYTSFLQHNFRLWILPPFLQQLECVVVVQTCSFSLEVESPLLPGYFTDLRHSVAWELDHDWFGGASVGGFGVRARSANPFKSRSFMKVITDATLSSAPSLSPCILTLSQHECLSKLVDLVSVCIWSFTSSDKTPSNDWIQISAALIRVSASSTPADSAIVSHLVGVPLEFLQLSQYQVQLNYGLGPNRCPAAYWPPCG